ncbi:putative chromosome transmission fidelity factor [Phaeomoniella chlamydospora]|uniref:Replication factor C subunit 1 n=1 Tax=Phaeomoniella chlamydospora TaxID=158046 RepID=A0A0G2GXN2_PHACM|nr:putative chromosome transmission fidelity factor [Phaeomoniella chlamydospora]
MKKPKKQDPVKSKQNKSKDEPQSETTTSSEYFASNTKSAPSRSTPSKGKSGSDKTKTNNLITTTPTKFNGRGSATPASSTRKSGRRSAVKTYNESDDDLDALLKVDDENGGDDIHATGFKKRGKDEDEYQEAESDEDSLVVQKPLALKANNVTGKSSTRAKKHDFDMVDAELEDDKSASKKNANGVRTSALLKSSKKRKSADLDDQDDDEHIPKKAAKKPAPRPAAKKSKPADHPESKEIQAIFDSIPTVRAPTPPARDEDRKFVFGAHNNTTAAPPACGTKTVPVGAENCLAGLTFVFTGILESISRDEGQALVKRYGGKVTTAPSKNTSYVVLGSEAGPKKLETIRKLSLKTIDEDGLFALIEKMPANGGDGKQAEKHAEKKAKEEAKIREEAAEMERLEKQRAKEAAEKTARQNGITPSATPASQPQVDSRLWTEKYAPTSLQAVCGNKGLVEKLQRWLRNWHYNSNFQFKKAGADGTGIYRAAMLHGPPGIGKTTAAHLIAKLEGYDVVETNASDTRSKKLVETGLKGVLDTTSLLGYFAGDGKKVEASKRKLCLVMDEVDGMSAGDRGGVGALASIAKKTNIPIILICNERRLPKMRPFDHVTADFQFRRPTSDQIRARLMTICYREGIKLSTQVLDALIQGTHADIRQVINMISTAKLDKTNMDFDEGTAMSKAWEKHVILKPWDITSKILRPGLWAGSATETLNDKIELYFNDHEFSYLMLQENYLKTTPVRANATNGKERAYKLLEIYDNAAESISDGDLVDRMIHGSQQQWSLMPTHAVFSFVRPASYAYGNLNGQVGFTSWLGQNSKFGKLSRFVKEIQGHMRLRASGDRHEIRQQYLPALWNRTVKRLMDDGKEAVDEIIDLMDSYFLTKEDYDAMIELGLGEMDEEKVRIDPTTKSSFTRQYNARSHPLPFMKSTNVKAPRVAGKEKPDLEEAIEEEEDDIAVENDVDGDEEEDTDLTKDKYIKAPKKKPGGKGGTGAKKGKGKKSADDLDAAVDDENDEKVKKPANGKGGRKGKGKA